MLATPDSDPLVDLKTGATHRITGLLGADPVVPPNDDGAACPHCGGRLRVGQTVDAAGAAIREAASRLALDETFGIVDAGSSVRRVPADGTPVEGWNSMETDSPIDAPDFVCESCGRHVDAHERGGDPGSGHVLDARAAGNASPVAASPDRRGGKPSDLPREGRDDGERRTRAS